MSNLLRDAAETTLHAAESTLHTVAEMVEGALQHVEVPTRKRSSRGRGVLVAVALVMVGGTIWLARRLIGGSATAVENTGSTDAEAEATQLDGTLAAVAVPA